MKQRQSDNEIWSVNRIWHVKYLSKAWRLSPRYFLFSKKTLNDVVNSLVSRHKVKMKCIKFPTVDPDIHSVWPSRKNSGTGFSAKFCYQFFKRNISHVTGMDIFPSRRPIFWARNITCAPDRAHKKRELKTKE